MLIRQALELYLADQELRGNTEKTVKNYRQFCGYFLNYYGPEQEVSDLTLQDLQAYQLWLGKRNKYIGHILRPEVDKPIEKRTVRTYISNLRSFIVYLFQEGLIDTDIAKKLKVPKAPKTVIEILSDQEIQRILDYYGEKSELQLRNKCVVALMVDCGLRRREVTLLDVDHIHFDQNLIKVQGKGQKERLVPLGTYTKRLLMKYIYGYRSFISLEDRCLFVSADIKPMSENAVKLVMQRLSKGAGITRLHPHLLRHTFATKYLINGGDLFSLQMILGHTSLDMVKKYSHLASAHVIRNFHTYSPLDTMQRNKR